MICPQDKWVLNIPYGKGIFNCNSLIIKLLLCPLRPLKGEPAESYVENKSLQLALTFSHLGDGVGVAKKKKGEF